MTRQCALCQKTVTLALPDSCRSEKRSPWGSRDESLRDPARLAQAEAICSACVRRLGQNPEDRIVVLRGAYYRRVGEAHVRIAPVGAFHG